MERITDFVLIAGYINVHLIIIIIPAYLFLNELGQKISAVSGEEREGSYLFQRISVLVQRYNAVMLHESFSDDNRRVLTCLSFT